MPKQFIAIALTNGAKVYGIEADVAEGIAIHTGVIDDAWVVTHVQSGAAFGRFSSLALAKRFRAHLLTLRINDQPLGALPGCELCANALFLEASFAAFRSRPRTDSEILATAAKAADLLCAVVGNAPAVRA